MVDGQFRPLQVTTKERGRKVKRWVMCYQQPGESPLPLGEPVHQTSLQARHDPAAKKWVKRINTEGYLALQELREKVAAQLAAEQARKAAEKEAKAKAEAKVAAEMAEKSKAS